MTPVEVVAVETMVVSVDVARKIGEASRLKLVEGVRRTYYWGYSCKNCEFSNNLESYKENFSLEFISSFGSSTERSKSSPPIVTLAFLRRGVFIFLYCGGVFCCSNFFFMTSGEA